MVKNEVLCGHICFETAARVTEPTVLGAPYNMSARRYSIADGGAVIGAYVLTVGKCMAPPADEDADISTYSSLTPAPVGTGLWTGLNVTDMGVNTISGDHEYLVYVTEEVAGGLSIQASDTADVVIGFTIKRVTPRVS